MGAEGSAKAPGMQNSVLEVSMRESSVLPRVSQLERLEELIRRSSFFFFFFFVFLSLQDEPLERSEDRFSFFFLIEPRFFADLTDFSPSLLMLSEREARLDALLVMEGGGGGDGETISNSSGAIFQLCEE